MRQQLYFGSDPEFMIVDRDGIYRSAIPIIKAGKERKIELSGGNKMFYDNVLLELNITPVYNETDLIINFSRVFKEVAKYIRPYVLTVQSSQTYPPQECLHEEAQRFGCEPELCAYTMKQIKAPDCEQGNTFRSAGGHIHLGFKKTGSPLMAPLNGDDTTEREWERVWVIRMMDLFVGIPSLLIDHDPTSAKRRKLYGGAGTHRQKKEYGVEYRATGNFWLASPKLSKLIFNLSDFVVDFCYEKGYNKLWKDKETCMAYDVDKLIKCINSSNISMAKEFMEGIVKKYLPNKLLTEIFICSEKKPYNFYKEWGIA